MTATEETAATKRQRTRAVFVRTQFYEEAIGEISILFFLAAMRIVLQRVLSASVTVDGKMISKIGKGIMCLVGIRDDDDQACSEVLAKKMLVE